MAKADKDNPLDFLKDVFEIVRPFSVTTNENATFHCKPATDDEFDECIFQTPSEKTLLSQSDGNVIDMETNEIVPGIKSFFEFDSQLVCGLEISNFTHEHFGWWSCLLNSYSENDVGHVGTFKINQPGEWPKDIRLPEELLVIFHDIWILMRQ